MSTTPTWHPRAVTTMDPAVLLAEPQILLLHHYMGKHKVLREHPRNRASAPNPVLKELISTDNISEASLHCQALPLHPCLSVHLLEAINPANLRK